LKNENEKYAKTVAILESENTILQNETKEQAEKIVSYEA
jgi:septal ring factor EnvC (AmiA/AmiB activator)